ncbi:MAG: hypothetical protein Q4F72_13020 [Desulfovibrionaceae bacterium]|nr:hypothetical protein [Desulfovibrionaceae bacterium]
MAKLPSVLLTLLERDEALARQLGNEISRLGADCQGHFWNDRPDAQVLSQLFKELCKPDLGAWVVAGGAASFTKETLSAMSLAMLAARHSRAQLGLSDLPLLISPSGSEAPSLPTPLEGAQIVVRGLGAKTVAALHTARALPELPYRLNVMALHGLGLWVEVGPSGEPWEGALLGTRGCSPDTHGVGQAGIIPQRCTLRYPVSGMKLNAESGEFTAWGTGNKLTVAESYFARLDGLPEALIFGPFPGEDDPELYVLDLC